MNNDDQYLLPILLLLLPAPRFNEAIQPVQLLPCASIRLLSASLAEGLFMTPKQNYQLGTNFINHPAVNLGKRKSSTATISNVGAL